MSCRACVSQWLEEINAQLKDLACDEQVQADLQTRLVRLAISLWQGVSPDSARPEDVEAAKTDEGVNRLYPRLLELERRALTAGLPFPIDSVLVRRTQVAPPLPSPYLLRVLLPATQLLHSPFPHFPHDCSFPRQLSPLRMARSSSSPTTWTAQARPRDAMSRSDNAVVCASLTGTSVFFVNVCARS